MGQLLSGLMVGSNAGLRTELDGCVPAQVQPALMGRLSGSMAVCQRKPSPLCSSYLPTATMRPGDSPVIWLFPRMRSLRRQRILSFAIVAYGLRPGHKTIFARIVTVFCVFDTHYDFFFFNLF